MKKYTCTNCSYTYDESLGDKEEGVAPGSYFEDMEEFLCPVCSSGSDYFMEIKEEINYKNEDFEINVEREHIPVYEIDGDKLIVTIGKEIHDMGEEHFISSISLYDEYGDIIEEKTLYGQDDPVCEFDISGLDSVELISRCTIHGLWSSGTIKL